MGRCYLKGESQPTNEKETEYLDLDSMVFEIEYHDIAVMTEGLFGNKYMHNHPSYIGNLSLLSSWEEYYIGTCILSIPVTGVNVTIYHGFFLMCIHSTLF